MIWSRDITYKSSIRVLEGGKGEGDERGSALQLFSVAFPLANSHSNMGLQDRHNEHRDEVEGRTKHAEETESGEGHRCGEFACKERRETDA